MGPHLRLAPVQPAEAGTVTIPILPLQTQFEERLTQVDVRLARTFRMGRARLQAKFDVYNVFNASTILAVNPQHGPSWLQPTFILSPRTFKFGAQLDF